MGLVKLTGVPANRYRIWLDDYRKKTGKAPGYAERAEAFFCALSPREWDRPWWVK